MSGEAFEFDVVVTVRKRIWFSGPANRELARELASQCIPSMGFGPFAKLGEDGKPIEQILSNSIQIEDPR
jgi:hypothetical protein